MNIAILDHPLISERYFFPRRESFADPFWIDCGDARLACHYNEISATAPTIVHFHGNGEVVADYIDFLPGLFARLGCNCLLTEFRGYGMSTGTPQLGRILDDVACILDQLPVAVERAVFFGRSVGSIPALEAIRLRPDAAGLVIESGIADVLQRLLLRISPSELGVTHDALRREVDSRLDQEQKIATYTGPLLIMHTANDGLVDVSHARQLHQAAGSGNKQLEVFAAGDHNSIMAINAEAYFGLIARFLATL